MYWGLVSINLKNLLISQNNSYNKYKVQSLSEINYKVYKYVSNSFDNQMLYFDEWIQT